MFDDFRQQASNEEFYKEDQEEQVQDSAAVGDAIAQAPEVEPRLTRRRVQSSHFLGMTAPQRFVIAAMLLMMVCILGCSLLFVTEKIVPF